ncbi:MAG: hypothetical protein U9Q24_01255 [Candidatus Ratteibacteria bacterium]|nr:hypothetical protein [Candidatus Ratteibacteria bacterium]
MKSILYLEPYLVDGIKTAKPEAGKYRVEFSTDDLAESLGALSYSTSYTVSPGKKEEIHSLHDKIEGYLKISQRLVRIR